MENSALNERLTAEERKRKELAENSQVLCAYYSSDLIQKHLVTLVSFPPEHERFKIKWEQMQKCLHIFLKDFILESAMICVCSVINPH